MSISKRNSCTSQYETFIQFIPEIFLVKSLLNTILLGEYFHLDPQERLIALVF